MKRLILLLLVSTELIIAQDFAVRNIIGYATAQNSNNRRIELTEGTILAPNTIVIASENSVVQLKSLDKTFTLKGPAAVTISDIRKASADDVLRALPITVEINPQEKKKEIRSKNPEIYGSGKRGKALPENNSYNFGIKRLNGAMQLAENGYPRSALIVANSAYRKYPEIRDDPFYRIFFAKVLYQLNLFEQASREYDSIRSLELTPSQKAEVNSKINELESKIKK